MASNNTLLDVCVLQFLYWFEVLKTLIDICLFGFRMKEHQNYISKPELSVQINLLLKVS